MTDFDDLVAPLPAGATVPSQPPTADALPAAVDSVADGIADLSQADGGRDLTLPGGFVELADLPSPAIDGDLHKSAHAPGLAASLARQATIEKLLDESAQANRDGQHHTGAAQAEQVLTDPFITPGQEARARQLLSGHRLRLGEFEASVRHGLLALEYLAASGDQLGQSMVHCTLALAFHETALEEPALGHVLGALEAARACGSRTAEFWALSRSSMVHQALGDADRSIVLGRQALALADTLGDPQAEFAARNNLGDSYLEIARAQRAKGEDAQVALRDGIDIIRAAVVRSVKQRHAFDETIARTNLVGFLIERGEYAEARRQAGRSKTIAITNGYRNLAVNNDAQLAEVARAEGRIDLACTMMNAQLADPSVAEDAALNVTLHRSLYEMHRAAGRFEQALEHHEQLHVLILVLTRQTAGLQSRMLINSLEIEQARHEAQRSQLEAEMQRVRAEELDQQAHTDPLTRLPNRRALDRQLPEMMRTARERSEPLCAVMIDMDHFKKVNDEHGHATGDRVLTTMAAILGDATRDSDLAVRVGGEEFLLVLGNTTTDQAVQICERLLGKVRNHPWGVVTAGLRCTASVGVALLKQGESVSRWLGRADAALYEAKASGRDRVELAASRA
ncbi:GGDEF domain-containing protein [Cryobacterium adonitolivorans]|uniref:GGDEF domain-containing protein n=1 Tax=Cryobacterium adonitolivorans TaxID=1259189 RepID=A0A4R8W6V8_9MICO|nr:GGDEF domain-containing protein [Cryobacterium adonitolivorans]TFC01675.1 GGDEF domain-containing protein [Cryobacterium adonitolivorans]